jgi:hypothetical protein
LVKQKISSYQAPQLTLEPVAEPGPWFVTAQTNATTGLALAAVTALPAASPS